MRQPRQHTDLLMLPVDGERTEQLAAPSSWSGVGDVAIELLLGIAAISNERRRQRIAARAVRSIFMHTSEGKLALQNYVASIYERREKQG